MTETTDTVYAAGWRQGAVLKADVAVVSTIRNPASGNAKESRAMHSMWALVTQDCNLYRMQSNVNSSVMELRQVYDTDPPAHEGIHARKFLLDADRGHYLVDDKPVAFVSPRFICDPGLAQVAYYLGDARVLALKAWLGRRYDRPAVPDEYVPLAKAIAESVKDGKKAQLIGQIRDVYMQFSSTGDHASYSLYAVITEEADPAEVREWLAERAFEVPDELGIVSDIQALTASQISYATIETSYCADLSQLTWMGDGVVD